MLAKELLIQDEKLKAWWSSIVGDSRFDRIVLILKASTFEGKPSPDQMSGITAFIENMESIINPDEAPTDYANPGLTHNLDVPRKHAETEEPAKHKKKK